MGQKIQPVGFRLGVTSEWSSVWYAEKGEYRKNLNEDLKLRDFIRAKLKNASVSRVQIDRLAGKVSVTVHTARPGIVIGKKGEDIEKLRQAVQGMVGMPVKLSVEEIRKPELDAYLVAESVAQQLERRIMFRRAMKRAVSNAMRLGAGGIKIEVSGRLNGAEIARTEWYREGRVPLHTLRADVDYGLAEAKTTYGIIGIKVWVFRGEVFEGQGENTTREAAA
ncbi:30S ribosomal protein S3 [Oceanococcus atlanticus]|uniref:Small ribosomal subunit protein uS3 n=1 Tax=Oceanococcus atlanticus TaxID=1317117 RepID=A0A1Y1SH32_9GAMM|nr:30S ribosomal protein S3 [Oceanococcus atlanticus]ORE88975.1 30S ribosomal protein S3 [Oceanococcus atlanticus]